MKYETMEILICNSICDVAKGGRVKRSYFITGTVAGCRERLHFGKLGSHDNVLPIASEKLLHGTVEQEKGYS